jgi:hypothetical protein
LWSGRNKPRFYPYDRELNASDFACNLSATSSQISQQL